MTEIYFIFGSMWFIVSLVFVIVGSVVYRDLAYAKGHIPDWKTRNARKELKRFTLLFLATPVWPLVVLGVLAWGAGRVVGTVIHAFRSNHG